MTQRCAGGTRLRSAIVTDLTLRHTAGDTVLGVSILIGIPLRRITYTGTEKSLREGFTFNG